jgi:hypothetical protein
MYHSAMRYENIKDRKDTSFKRLTGVPHQLFSRMGTVIKKEVSNFGRPIRLSLEDQISVYDFHIIEKRISPNKLFAELMSRRVEG